MKPCTSATAAAIAALAVALTATACDGQSGDAADKPSASSGGWDKPRLPTYEVAKDVKFDSPTLRKAQRAGKLVIGAKNDQRTSASRTRTASGPASTSRSRRWSPPTSGSPLK